MEILLNQKFTNIRLHLITGPMFSGKTTKLINFVDEHSNNKTPQVPDSNSFAIDKHQNKTIIFKYFLDDRYSSNQISTHNKVMRPAIPCQSLTPYLKDCDDKEVVAIDEAQFFDDLFDFIYHLIESRNNKEASSSSLDIFVDSLDGDFLRHPFGQVLDLLPICNSFFKLRTLWKTDGKETSEQDSLFKIKGAPFSLRTNKSSKVKLIGGEESYKAATRSEYIKQSQSLILNENKISTIPSILPSKFGFVSLFIGKKKSGKTKELIKKIFEIENFNSNHPENEKKKIIFVSTDFDSISQIFLKCKTTQNLPSFNDLINFDCILIDDFHCYPNSSELCDSLANNGKFVFASGLSSDENGKVPPEVKLLIPMSESTIFLNEI